jgi:hypothetical protein
MLVAPIVLAGEDDRLVIGVELDSTYMNANRREGFERSR